MKSLLNNTLKTVSQGLVAQSLGGITHLRRLSNYLKFKPTHLAVNLLINHQNCQSSLTTLTTLIISRL
jgi:hypothetical protein